MKFTRVVVACNVCYMQTDGEVETEAGFSLRFRKSEEPSAPEFTIDLCDTHAAEIRPLLEKYAEKIAGAKRAPGRPRKAAPASESATVPVADASVASVLAEGRLPCPHCGKSFKPGVGMSMHTKTKHPEEWDKELARREKEKAESDK